MKIFITDRSKLSRSLAYKNKFALIWQLIDKLEYLFCQVRWDTAF